MLNDELLTVKKKKLNEDVLMKKLNDDADKFVEQAAQDRVGVEEVRLLVLKAQSFKKSAMGKDKVIRAMNRTMVKIGKEPKTLK